MNATLKDLFARLAEPFNPQDLEWRAGATNSDKTKALALAYITSRAVMDRLDDVVGPQNWRDEYASGPDGGVICGLTLRIDGEWITKWDGAENTEFEAIKGGLSDAFKRAGYKWGIGRYLYKLDNVWVPCEQHGKTIVLKSTPPLPAWALPDEWLDAAGRPLQRKIQTDSAAEREKQILAELGFGDKAPEKEPVPVTAPIALPTIPENPGGNGSSGKPLPQAVPPTSKGNGSQPQRPKSWSSALVQAMLKSKLASSPIEAVRLLNESGLPQDITPEQAIQHFTSQQNP